MPGHDVGLLLNSCRGRDEVSASTVERGGGILAPCYLHDPSQLHFWTLSLRLCRWRLLYKDVGVEEQVHPLAQGRQGAARHLKTQVTLCKSMGMLCL